MNKKQILEEINRTKEYLANMEKMLEECEYKRWKPEYMQKYRFVNAIGEVCENIWGGSNIDQCKYNFYNCFQTREQAKAEAEKILVRRMLENIARRLNRGEKINWNNCGQSKYAIDLYLNDIYPQGAYAYKSQGTVYCLDKSFKDVAIKEIGEERLKKYLRGE